MGFFSRLVEFAKESLRQRRIRLPAELPRTRREIVGLLQAGLRALRDRQVTLVPEPPFPIPVTEEVRSHAQPAPAHAAPPPAPVEDAAPAAVAAAEPAEAIPAVAAPPRPERNRDLSQQAQIESA